MLVHKSLHYSDVLASSLIIYIIITPDRTLRISQMHTETAITRKQGGASTGHEGRLTSVSQEHNERRH